MANKKKATKVAHVEIRNQNVERAENYIRMVGSNHMLGCTLIGPAGMGKTHLVRNTLDEMNVEYEVYGGHITLAAIYEYLYEFSDRTIFFDDVSQVINKTEIMEMLKQALDPSGHTRVLHYRSNGGSLAANTPTSFEFTARMIFTFNTAEKNSPNVKAVFSRAPPVELKYTRKEIIDAMFEIAKGNGGGLMEHEKMIVSKEIEDYTDVTMDVSLRDQQQAFKIYFFHKKMEGVSNTTWKGQVHALFGKKKRHWITDFMMNDIGVETMDRLELTKQCALHKDMSLRTAQRRLAEAIEMGELFANKLKGGTISVKKQVNSK